MRVSAPSFPRGVLAAATAATLVVAPLALGLSTPASAVSPNIVISEVYGGGGNGTAPTYTNDFVELYNAGTSPVSVAGWSVQYRSATGTSAQVTPLSGTIAPGAHYLVRQAAGTTTGTKTLPTPDATGSVAMSGTAGVALLANDTTAIAATGNLAANASTPPPSNLVDMIGFGTTPTSFETARTGAALSEVLSAQRTGADTDDNAADFTRSVPDAQNSGPATPTGLEATFPGDQTGQVDSPVAPFAMAATGGTSPYTWTATGLPAGVIIASNGTVSGTPTTAGAYTVTATATDAATPTPASDDVTFAFTVSEAATPTSIAEIQGTGAASPFAGQSVITQGVVTASYPTGGLNGFYLQTPGSDTTDASDAIFVYGGASGFATYPAVGDSVKVSGEAAEFSGQTQIAALQAGITPIAPLGTVIPKTTVPGTVCALPGTTCLDGAALNEAREVAEGELFQPTAPWTATDVYDGSPYYQGTSNSGAFRGEIGVAADSDAPLVSPTEVIDAQATAQIGARTRYNDAHRIVMDDGSSWTYSTSSHANDPFPWFTPDHTVRVGAGITFPKPVIFTQGFSTWRILPQGQIVGAPTGRIDIEQTRPATPEDVGGDVTLATFNVLNFFPTTGEEFVSSGLGTCSYFYDRANNAITNNRCNPDGPRGAANEANLARQRDKIVAAINTANADVVSLEELENSVKFGKDRDFAINQLVAALNEKAGAGTWAAVASPSTLPATADQDVIRNGFIYQPARVSLVGDSVVLSDESTTGGAFADAREPLAQAFKEVGTPDAGAFAVIVNHFKSKGSGNPDPDGQGNATDQRVAQAKSLVRFADEFTTARGITRVFLAGDFNAYSQEDPIQVLEEAGYTSLDSTSNPDEETYNFDGMVGSLDHVLANGPALADVNAVDVWDINGYESVYYEYARFNSNATNLYAPNPFRSSDHSPEIVGINSADIQPVSTTITGAAAPIEYGSEGSVAIEVSPSTATGTVTVDEGGNVLGSATLASGAATVVIAARTLSIGSHTLTLTYAGDAWHETSTGSVTVTVTKASPTISTDVTPERVVAKDTKPRVIVTVSADGLAPTGTVLVAVDGTSYWASLRDGTAVLELKKFKKPGSYAAAVSYFGDAYTKAATVIVTIQVDGR